MSARRWPVSGPLAWVVVPAVAIVLLVLFRPRPSAPEPRPRPAPVTPAATPTPAAITGSIYPAPDAAPSPAAAPLDPREERRLRDEEDRAIDKAVRDAKASLQPEQTIERQQHFSTNAVVKCRAIEYRGRSFLYGRHFTFPYECDVYDGVQVRNRLIDLRGEVEKQGDGWVVRFP